MSETSDQGMDPLVAGRRDRHQEILESGGYPHRYERSHLAAELHETFADLPAGSETDDRVTVAGRLMLHRSFGKLQFGTLQDETGTIQLFVDRSTIGDEKADAFAHVDLGDWLGASGTVMTTRKGELSVRTDDYVILQKSLHPLPEKWHGLQDIELRSRRRYLDLMVNDEARRVARARAVVVSELRRQFEARGFVEVETPILLHQATGATARPFATHHHALNMDMNLRIATELYLKRLVVGGMEKVFEIGRIFRNEGIDSTHNPEFTMLEAYQALADYRDMMDLTEEVVSGLAREVTGGTRLTYQGRELDLSRPFRRASMTELVSEKVGSDVDLDTPLDDLASLARERGIEIEDGWSEARIISEIYEEIVEAEIWDPTFVTHQPIEISPLARRNATDPRLADRFELVIAGSEYANAFSELNDADDQRLRFEEQAAARAAGDEEAHPVDHDYLLALEYGLPPTGGLGIGVDRLVMLFTDQAHIREVILFPTLRPEA
ncbi:MAG TPA: lysine--tRNA ligase [Acidimicrobiia bacterium]|nr:lysine--tRNA ligase [Acidimicrobiia bacterium]